MIQPLRDLHRRSFVLLAVALPTLFIAGLLVRRPLVPPERVSDRISLVLPSGAEAVVDSRELWGSAVDDPDPLVYWTAASASPDSLPGDARLLGSLDAARHGHITVPADTGGRGYLILYSLAWRKPVARASVPKEMP